MVVVGQARNLGGVAPRANSGLCQNLIMYVVSLGHLEVVN